MSSSCSYRFTRRSIVDNRFIGQRLLDQARFGETLLPSVESLARYRGRSPHAVATEGVGNLDGDVDGDIGEELGEFIAEGLRVALEHPVDALAEADTEPLLLIEDLWGDRARFPVIHAPGHVALSDHFQGDRDVGVASRDRPGREIVRDKEVAHASLEQVAQHHPVEVLDEIHRPRIDAVLAQQHLEEEADAGAAAGLHQDGAANDIGQSELFTTGPSEQGKRRAIGDLRENSVVLYSVAVHGRNPDPTKGHVGCAVGECVENAIPRRRDRYFDLEPLVAKETMAFSDILGEVVEIVAGGGKVERLHDLSSSRPNANLTGLLMVQYVHGMVAWDQRYQGLCMLWKKDFVQSNLLKAHFFFCTYLGKQQRADPRGFTLDPIVIRDRRGWIESLVTSILVSEDCESNRFDDLKLSAKSRDSRIQG